MNRIEQQRRARLIRIEHGLQERREREALKASLEQTAALARRRGEDVGQDGPRLRIWSRDGLRTLYEGDAIDPAEYEAGLLYRCCLEAVDRWRVSDLAQLPGCHPLGGGDLQALRALQLAAIEGLSRTGREATTLLRIAGEGRAMRSISRGGADYALNCKALRRVLGAVADRFGL
jgi:hypothetical protein